MPDAAADPVLNGAVVGADGVARCPWGDSNDLLREYHDTEWGMPVHGDQALYERLMLEAFQSGLSWLIILRKRDGFRAAFANFDPAVVAAYGPADVERLMNDAGIVRNRLKVAATITNAKALLALHEAEGEGALGRFVASFAPAETPQPRTQSEVPTKSPESLALSKALKKRGFVFVGPTTAYALMEATGVVDTHLVGCHRRGCSGHWPA